MQVGDRSKAKPECALGGKTNSNAATEVHRMLTIDHLQHARFKCHFHTSLSGPAECFCEATLG